ncbi:restriction endonuclease subunit S [Halorubrum sp. BV1]|uniref:restriction endonuclease subunit S n=1 Tax=Halorubrum sp. BV1 TaxID=1498500 RepID=UPI0009B5C103|nr:restriction endonuclease subunit S [Halorubrum sp. BV1]
MSEELTLDEFAQQEKGGEQGQDWEKIQLHDVAYKRSDNVDPQKIALEKHVGLEHIDPNNPVPDWEPLDDLSSTKRRFEAGDILFAKLRPNLEKSAQPEFEGVASTDIFPIVAESGVNSKWLLYRLSSKPAYDYARRTSAGTRMPRTSWNLFSKFSFDLPPLPEQRKIATVLYTVDRAIEKTEEIIFQLNRLKQGLYQTLFFEGYNQHDQFKSSKYGEIPESWEVSKLSEVTSQIQAGGTPDTDVPEYYGGDIPWVKTGELSQYRVTETEQTITEKGFEESTARLFSPGTILIAMYGATTGEVSLLDIEATTNQACCGVVTTDEIRGEFLFHQLNFLSTRLESLSAGSGQQNISKGIIEKFDVLVPPIEEQVSIVRIMNTVDESIDENKTTKKQYQSLKRGLMQDLLSGTVRTTDTTIEVPDEIAQHG